VDLARAGAVEKELDAMIRRRDDKRRETEGERRERELWTETEARHVGKRREQNRARGGLVQWESTQTLLKGGLGGGVIPNG